MNQNVLMPDHYTFKFFYSTTVKVYLFFLAVKFIITQWQGKC